MCFPSPPKQPDPLPVPPQPQETAQVVRTPKKLQAKKRRAVRKGAAQLRIPTSGNIGGY